jgi:hypothetical protein
VAVALANSAPIGYPAVLFAGADNEGNFQYDSEKLESVAKRINGLIDQAFPAIYRHIVPLQADGRGCLAVIIPGSPARPHFAGKSYVRVGPEVKEASQDQFDGIVAQRQSKAYEILKWKGSQISVQIYAPNNTGSMALVRTDVCLVVDCNVHFVTLNQPNESPYQSFPLERLLISFDRQTKRLILEAR